MKEAAMYFLKSQLLTNYMYSWSTSVFTIVFSR